MISRLQYISQNPHLQNIQEACEAGCDWVQLRVKETSEGEYLSLAGEARKITRLFGAKLIINDHLGIALEVKADGVHLGKKDLDLTEARKLAGKNFLIGGSTNSFEDILEASQKGVDYLGLGPFRTTVTKTDLNPILGIEGIADIMEKVTKQSIQVPIIAIGGIMERDVPLLMRTGIFGVAVSGVISLTNKKQETVRDLVDRINKFAK
jgi:thiamine-phosphate pyrophosphorylase